MSNLNGIEMNLGCAASLVIVTSLEVTKRRVELVSIKLLKGSSVDGNTQFTLFVTNLIGPTRRRVNLADRSTLLLAVVARAQLHAKVELALGVDVQLGNWLMRDTIVNMHLANTNLSSVLDNLEVTKQAVDVLLGVPAARAVFAELATAMLAVGSADTFRVLRISRDLMLMSDKMT